MLPKLRIVRNSERYSLVSSDSALGEASFRPYLPFSLIHQQGSVTALGLLDTGAQCFGELLLYRAVTLAIALIGAYRVVKLWQCKSFPASLDLLKAQF
ncbi:MAG: hypothetical protein KME20_05390 [Kaiparowitsia implicata GSE-PSE-MK54-09C]|nr:hypothetical protein [Kaiparowitsia implicata GSE-PSE-MK54-09C]